MDKEFTTVHSTIININNNIKYKQCQKIHKKYMRARWICIMFEFFDLKFKNHSYYNTLTCDYNGVQCYNKKYKIDNTLMDLEIQIMDEIFHIHLNLPIDMKDNNLLKNLNYLFEDFEKKIKTHISHSCDELELSNEI